LNVSAIILATGFNLLDSSVVMEYGYKRHKNVVSSMELERLVNASGPTGGKLLRPSDNEEPHRIAFIQCVGSRNLNKGVSYCSSACCMYATKEAILIREHKPESEAYIFHIDQRVFGKGFQEFVRRAEEHWGVRYIRSSPGEIEEDPETGELTVWYEDPRGKGIKEMKVDLVVLCPALIPREKNKELANLLSLDVDEYGFFKSKDVLIAPVDTSKAGVFMCGYCQGPKDIPECVAQASAAAARAAEVVSMSIVGRGM
ncbi:MAG: CoB--CoM heterodisulfide reductase iron-sulfur subunit A family protein, partial [Candidatus Bathyarchaeota archaeon]